jgi:hypothetical protein
MPSFGRLLRMNRAELAFRGRQLGRIALERVNVAAGRERWRRDRLAAILSDRCDGVASARAAASGGQWTRAHELLSAHFSQREPRFPLDPARRQTLAEAIRERFPQAAIQAGAMASPIVEHRFDLLGYSQLSFASSGSPVNWHVDPVHARRAPRRFWSDVPYLDPACGDHKIIWELNRHQHWLALGRAAWLTGDPPYGRAFRSELASWLEANPPLLGINWASMLEVGLRTISWVWALHFFCADANDDDAREPWLIDLLVGLDRQLDHITHHLSTYFSPNTHLLGEGVALYVAGRALPELASARRWESIGREVLLHEARAQVLDDGGHVELSLHYHRYALDFYLLALAVARRTGDPDAERLSEVTSRLASFCRAMADERGCLATIGDDDGGMVFPICGREPRDVRDSLGISAALLDQPYLAVGPVSEEVIWMLGGVGEVRARSGEPPPASCVLGRSGYVVIRAGRDHAILDAGRHGFLNGGHAHSDALSMVLSLDARPLLIDPGTATYTMAPAVRDRFRATAMHNTLVVDGRPQSVPAGPFHWATQANASLDVTSFGGTFDYAEAFHNGYAPLVHRRALLRTDDGLWLVADHLHGRGRHDVDAYWHIDPTWRCGRTTSRAAQLLHEDDTSVWLGSTAGHLRRFHGDQDGLGWCSPVYGRTIESTTLRFSYDGCAPLSMVTAIAAGSAVTSLALEVLHTSIDSEDGWHRIAVSISRNDVTDIALFASQTGATVTDSAFRRELHRIATGRGDLITDARAALLTLSPRGEPSALILVDASAAIWTGVKAFEYAWEAAHDVHLDLAHGSRRFSSCVA